MTNREIMVDELAKEVIKGTFGNVPDGGLTEDRIKNSACSWAWQFTKELPDEGN